MEKFPSLMSLVKDDLCRQDKIIQICNLFLEIYGNSMYFLTSYRVKKYDFPSETNPFLGFFLKTGFLCMYIVQYILSQEFDCTAGKRKDWNVLSISKVSTRCLFIALSILASNGIDQIVHNHYHNQRLKTQSGGVLLLQWKTLSPKNLYL